MVASPLVQYMGSQIAAAYLYALQRGAGVPVQYSARGAAPQMILALPMQPGQGEMPVLGVDADVTQRAWKIPVQYDASGVQWPADTSLPDSEDYLTDSEGVRHYVLEQPGAIVNLDGANAIWQIYTEQRHPHRVE